MAPTFANNGRKLVIYDAVGGANAAVDTGALDASNWDAVLIEGVPSGVAAAGSIQVFDADFALSGGNTPSVATPAASSEWKVAWGPGVAPGAAAFGYLGGVPAPLPLHVRINVSALGVGITLHLRVILWKYFD